MIDKKKFVKKIIVSIVTLTILFGLVFIFYINQNKFEDLNFNEVDAFIPELIKNET